MDKTDKNIIAGLLDLITSEADPKVIAEVLDDIMYIIGMNLAINPEDFPDTTHAPDQLLYFVRKLRNGFCTAEL